MKRNHECAVTHIVFAKFSLAVVISVLMIAPDCSPKPDSKTAAK